MPVATRMPATRDQGIPGENQGLTRNRKHQKHSGRARNRTNQRATMGVPAAGDTRSTTGLPGTGRTRGALGHRAPQIFASARAEPPGAAAPCTVVCKPSICKASSQHKMQDTGESVQLARVSQYSWHGWVSTAAICASQHRWHLQAQQPSTEQGTVLLCVCLTDFTVLHVIHRMVFRAQHKGESQGGKYQSD